MHQLYSEYSQGKDARQLESECVLLNPQEEDLRNL